MTGNLNVVQEFSVWILPIIFAVTLHEAAHGFVALACGDRTALRAGRISLNPLRHVDPVGTLLFPAVALLLRGPLFGWAKPVPVDFRNLRHPRRDMVLVALAGPGTNILLAMLSLALLLATQYLPARVAEWAIETLKASVWFNVILAVFNMLPVPPLDGGRVIVGLLPRRLAAPIARLEPYGLLIVLGLFVLVPLVLGPTGAGFSPFRWLVQIPSVWILKHLAALFGLS